MMKVLQSHSIGGKNNSSTNINPKTNPTTPANANKPSSMLTNPPSLNLSF